MNARRLAPFLAFTALAPLAAAKTLVVVQNGAITTIQSAIDLANGGDTVLVKAGVYVETLHIVGKNGLRLRAVGNVVLEGRTIGSAGDGPAIMIDASDVEIRGIDVRNAGGNATGAGAPIHATGSGLKLKQLRVEDCESPIVIVGNGARIDDCTLAMDGVAIQGNDARIDDCVFAAVTNKAILIEGDDARVSDSSCEGVSDGFGIEISGNRARVDVCKIRTTQAGGIDIAGNDAIVEHCRIEGTGEEAILIDGSGARVDDNKIQDCNRGLSLTGELASVRHNKIDHITAGAGITLALAPGAIVEANSVRFTSGVGIDIDTNSGGSNVTQNVVVRCAFEGLAGIVVAGNNVTLFDNLVKENRRAGVRVRGDGCTIESLSAVKNFGDGVKIEATAASTILHDVLSSKNTRHGLANLGADTSVTLAILLGNRLDLASNAAFAILDQVQFATGGAGVAVEPN